MNEELKQQISDLIDERIGELFGSGEIKVVLVNKTYAYSDGDNYSVRIMRGKECLHETSVKEEFSGL